VSAESPPAAQIFPAEEKHLSALAEQRLILAVHKRNVRPIAAYRRNGFAVIQSVVTDFGDGFVMDDFIMAKELNAQCFVDVLIKDFTERGCARSVSRSASTMLRLVCDTAALRSNHDPAHNFCSLDLFSKMQFTISHRPAGCFRQALLDSHVPLMNTRTASFPGLINDLVAKIPGSFGLNAGSAGFGHFTDAGAS
jgi:hypothetical protein